MHSSALKMYRLCMHDGQKQDVGPKPLQAKVDLPSPHHHVQPASYCLHAVVVVPEHGITNAFILRLAHICSSIAKMRLLPAVYVDWYYLCVIMATKV